MPTPTGNVNKVEREKEMKTLIVMPAHNEEQNIAGVIDEIKKDLPDLDLLVINDASTDKTEEIVKQNGVKCITLPFNLRYSLAVQTGIKYAEKHDYDYVIQMDADGQHIANEAKKLLEYMEENKPDIVIGSRFLQQTEYKHGAMRKLGTNILSGLIKLICHKEIKDPTSGFQCINRKTIKRFSAMGNYPEFPDANLIIELLLEGYEICEISIKMRQRQNGESMHKGIIKPAKYMIKVTYNIIIIILRNLFRKKK